MEAAPIHPDPRSLAQPRLSVVVAVFNEAENVQAVLDELATALDRLQPFEVLFVDDGSTDATAERIAALAKTHPGLRLLRHDRRCGKTAALRTGIAAVLADHCPDTGCGLKAFRRDDFLRLPVFEGMHRFLPALFGAYGHPLLCKTVSHRARMRGQSKYTNFGRALVGIGDMLGVIWLRRRTTVPHKVTES